MADPFSAVAADGIESVCCVNCDSEFDVRDAHVTIDGLVACDTDCLAELTVDEDYEADVVAERYVEHGPLPDDIGAADAFEHRLAESDIQDETRTPPVQ